MCLNVDDKYLIPFVQFIAALMVLAGVVISQIYSGKRQKQELDAKFALLKKEQKNKKKSEYRIEKLKKIENIFLLVLEVKELLELCFNEIELVAEESKSKESIEGIIFQLDKIISYSSSKRMNAQLLVAIYVSELSAFFEQWSSVEEQLRSSKIAIEASLRLMISPEYVKTDFIFEVKNEMLNYLSCLVKELSGYASQA